MKRRTAATLLAGGAVWFNADQVETINDLGEGRPLEERPWGE